LGRTRLEAVHVACSCGLAFSAEVVRAINATQDPSLATRFLEGTLTSVQCPACRAAHIIDVSVVFHDEVGELLVLVLPSSQRHRELHERAEAFLAMAREPAQAVPAYARALLVVYGPSGLADLLSKRAEDARQRAARGERDAELELRGKAIDDREALLANRAQELASHSLELEKIMAEVTQRAEELERRQRELAQRVADLEGRERELEARLQADLTPLPKPVPLEVFTGRDDGETARLPRLEQTDPGIRATTISDAPPPAPPPSEGSATEEGSAYREQAIERWIISGQPTLQLVEDGQVRLLCATSALDPFLSGDVAGKIHFYRLPTYPLLILSVAQVGDTVTEPLAFPLDLARVDDRAVLGALSSGFHAVVDLYDTDYLPVVQREIAAPLAENVRRAVTAAEEYLARLPVSQRSLETALAAWKAPGFDRFGTKVHNLTPESFAVLSTPGATKSALAVVAYYGDPHHEDYLFLVHSFPIEAFRRIRKRVVEKAVEFGLALPAPLAQLALSEGLARSPKELAQKLAVAFGDVASGAKPNDLPPEGERENWRVLVAECEALGVVLSGKAADLAGAAVGAAAPTESQRASVPFAASRLAKPTPSGGSDAAAHRQAASAAMASFGRQTDAGPSLGAVLAAAAIGQAPPRPVKVVDRETPRVVGQPELRRVDSPIVTGEILTAAPKTDVARASTETLIGLCEDKDLRRDACVELCRRGEVKVVGPVFAVLRRMTRGEAVRVLSAVVVFGDRAVPHLLDGLRSRKSFLRQGCALALGVLKSAEGIEPLCDLLIVEPTDVWREVARAIGEVGAGAVMSLAARLRDGTPEGRDRISWAMAYVVVRGGRTPIDTLAGGRDPAAAAVARKALTLADELKLNDVEVRGQVTPRDQTVNRAFSRRFFETMRGRVSRGTLVSPPPASGGGKGSDAGADGGDPDLLHELVDDTEILDADEELLDDEDLIPS
jgi:hypothetical protein